MERNDDDIRSLMTEYLECAEIKKKFSAYLFNNTSALDPVYGLDQSRILCMVWIILVDFA